MPRIRLLTLALVVAVLSAAQENQSSENAERHFRWSERQAHELDYGHTLAKARNLTAEDRRLLENAVYAALKRAQRRDPESFEDISDSQLKKFTGETRVESVDLNGDGTPEFIAQPRGMGPCGATGNCLLWIFQKTPRGLKVLLDSGRDGYFEMIIVRPWLTDGYHDIVLGSHSTATARELSWYKYRDGAYREYRCYYLSRVGENAEYLKSPEISETPCYADTKK